MIKVVTLLSYLIAFQLMSVILFNSLKRSVLQPEMQEIAKKKTTLILNLKRKERTKEITGRCKVDFTMNWTTLIITAWTPRLLLLKLNYGRRLKVVHGLWKYISWEIKKF